MPVQVTHATEDFAMIVISEQLCRQSCGVVA